MDFRFKYIARRRTLAAFALLASLPSLATDCPGHLQLNRIRIANLRLTAGQSAIHADILEWHPSDTPEGAARPILSAIFGVIQYSMMLRDLPDRHQKVIRHRLDFSQRYRETC